MAFKKLMLAVGGLAISVVWLTSCTITVIDKPPVAQFSFWPQNPLTLEPVYFDASASYDQTTIIIGLALVRYKWDFGDGSRAEGITVSHTYARSGTYKVTLTVIDDEGQKGLISQQITVRNRPPTADFTWYDCFRTLGEQVVRVSPEGIVPLVCRVFDGGASYDPDGWIVSYEWDFGDGTIGHGKRVWHEFVSGIVYTITLTVTDNEGARAQKQVNLRF